ncbi:CHAD domain-containing protein [Cupriavidus sp. WGlv3]|uniref:CHAD domain-containing protein n=1 Tax=Cupriavidus sp. WGlv3 TaxID=2919924 RepID=UPI002090A74D|nr:CHAD domain-containing protein [Cupriavidus sp. WGlv3]MCO4862844.1 CHAD domain-containing protein [Cupriavidus sp. WGlv3]
MNADAPSPKLRRKARPAAAFAALAQAGLARIDACLEQLQHRDDPEDLHQLRIALRHARAVVWAMGPALPRQERDRWKRDLRTLARATSAARDWDVFLAETVGPAREQEPDDTVLAAIADTARQRRNAAREAMLAALATYRDWPLPALHRDLAHLAHLAGRARNDRARLASFARQRVRRGRKQLRALARNARDGDPVAVHAQRIAGKRLRYVIEALAPVLPARYTRRLHRKLVKRQARLGRLVDGIVARRLLAECLELQAMPDDMPPPLPGTS